MKDNSGYKGRAPFLSEHLEGASLERLNGGQTVDCRLLRRLRVRDVSTGGFFPAKGYWEWEERSGL